MDKVFRVWVPKGGKRTERTETIAVKDAKVRVNILELATESNGKLVARTFLLQPPPAAKGKANPKGARPAPAPFPNPQAMTEAARDIFLKEVKGKVSDETEVSVGDLKGKEYVVAIDDKLSARTRVYVLGRFLFQVSIVGTKEQVTGKDAGTFLDSFKPTV